MPAKIAIITTDFLKEYMEKTLKDFPRSEEFELHYYSNFKSLANIYENLSSNIKGVVTSGAFPAQVMSLSFPDDPRPIRAFNNDNAGIYKLFLKLFNNDRNLQLSRIYADVLDVTNVNPEDYLFGDIDLNISDATHKTVSTMTIEELLSVEDYYADKHIELWRNKKTDISITRFSSVMEKLEKAGVNARFAFPDIPFVRNILLSALQDATIMELTKNLTCSILITSRNHDESLKNLRHALVRFGAFLNLNYQLQLKSNGFEVFTNKEAAQIITENFTTCKLRAFLARKLGFEVDIGYGIGFNLYQSRINAVDANRESGNFPFGTSSLIDENDRLIVPLNTEKMLTIPRNHSDIVKELSKTSGLSCLTIQKIISILNTAATDSVTSEELAYKLSISKRSANRFLSALKKSGLASIIALKQGSTRGRPEYVYRINLSVQATHKAYENKLPRSN